MCMARSSSSATVWGGEYPLASSSASEARRVQPPAALPPRREMVVCTFAMQARTGAF